MTCLLDLRSMESTIRIFSDFKEYNNNALYSNLEEKIRYDIAKAIKGERMFSRFAAWNFNGIICWHDELGYWCCEIANTGNK